MLSLYLDLHVTCYVGYVLYVVNIKSINTNVVMKMSLR